LASGTARDVATDPRWLPHTYDLSGSTITSVFVERNLRKDLMFLSDEHYKNDFRKVANPASAVAAHISEASEAPLHFIFHTAFCGSTLMVRALEVAGLSHGINEPDVLINLANRLIRRDDEANRERLRLVLRLLARPMDAGEIVVVKPSNFASCLLVPALEARPGTRAVLLYSDVRSLLRSILKRGLWGRIWGRRLFRTTASWSSLDFGYSEEETFVLTDLQALGLAWVMQMHHFREVAERMGDRVMLVDSADFLAEPGPALLRIARLFDLALDPSMVDRIVSGPTFARHSKFSDLDYGSEQRAADQSAVESVHHEELEMVVKWVEAVAAHMDVDVDPASRIGAAV
jgi:hypothetical protein